MISLKQSKVSDIVSKKIKFLSGNPLFLSLFVTFLIFLILLEMLSLSGFFYLFIERPLMWMFFVGITFIMLFLIFSRLIFERVRLIYKNIIEFKSNKKHSWLITYDALKKAETDVENWINAKTKEIAILKETEKYRREFIGNLAHELKTPLTTIQGYVLTLLDGGLYDDSINVKYLKRTMQNIERLMSIIHDLDEITKLEKGLTNLDLKNFDLYPLIIEVVELFEKQLLDKKISIKNSISPHQVIVLADYTKIRQVLINLIDNAIKYSDTNATIEIEADQITDRYLIEITDHGMGLEPEEIPRVFERFYRTERSRSKVKEGSGLGLSIVKHIIEAHGQTIHLRSAPGIGTTVSFTLAQGKI
jgi:two-component system phosphate regulon sensor histidine kinase PhoR